MLGISLPHSSKALQRLARKFLSYKASKSSSISKRLVLAILRLAPLTNKLNALTYVNNESKLFRQVGSDKKAGIS